VHLLGALVRRAQRMPMRFEKAHQLSAHSNELRASARAVGGAEVPRDS
jgi:hypothetical protein